MEIGLPGLLGLHVQKHAMMVYKDACVNVKTQHQQTVVTHVRGMPVKSRLAVYNSAQV